MKRKELSEASVRRNYAFSQRTIENLKWLIVHKIYRSETEAIDLAIERMRTFYEMRDEESKTSILENPEDAKKSKRVNSNISFFGTKRISSKPRTGTDIQVQFAFLKGNAPAITFASEGINRYFGLKRDKLFAML